ncbi:hypothetical protein [Marinicella sp. W31]|uniref:hypothetical protein n=1 Tax=Marinicella sp. W31 TaxID=3023713 RepID=UPI00375748E4
MIKTLILTAILMSCAAFANENAMQKASPKSLDSNTAQPIDIFQNQQASVQCAVHCRAERTQCLQTSSYGFCNAEFVKCVDTCLENDNSGNGSSGGSGGGDGNPAQP